MRLKFGKATSSKLVSRLKKKVRIRKRVEGSESSPRLNVYKSLNHMYAQIIDDVNGKTLVAVSTQTIGVKGKKGLEQAALVGAEIAKQAKTKNIEK